MEKLFKLKENGTAVKTEVVAGVTTFLAMAYILAVNPSMLGAAGMDSSAVFAATAVSAAFATLFMAFFANYPVALASGMGLNAYFAYTVVPQLASQGITNPWQVALTAILVEGIIFIILSLFKFRETLVNKVPKNLKLGISAGIGLFITIVGLKGAGVIVSDAYYDGTAVQSSTLVTLGDLGSANVVLAIVGLLIVAALWHFKVKGSILIGIIVTYIFGIIAQLCGWYQGTSLIPDFSNYAIFAPVQNMATETLFKFDFTYVAQNVINFAVIVFAFLFVDLFDTLGTIIGVSTKAGMLDENGKLPNIKPALMSDAIATSAGAILGTSTTTTFVESSAGVAEGGHTGLTAAVTGLLFLVSVVLSPLFITIPSFATAPALIMVGFLMFGAVTDIKFTDDNLTDAIPAYLCIIAMPLFYSISEGISIGIISYVLLNAICGKAKEVKPLMYILAVLFLLQYIFL